MSRSARTGDVLKIGLGDGLHGYGQLTQEGLLVVFDHVSGADLDPSDLMDIDVVFAVHVRSSDLASGRWPVIGRQPVPGDLRGHPMMFRQDAETGRLSVEHPDLPGGERPATLKECIGLERATIWSASAVEERLRDHVAGEDNRWLEELSIDLHRVPEDQLR